MSGEGELPYGPTKDNENTDLDWLLGNDDDDDDAPQPDRTQQ